MLTLAHSTNCGIIGWRMDRVVRIMMRKCREYYHFIITITSETIQMYKNEPKNILSGIMRVAIKRIIYLVSNFSLV